jgi:hypothetical protein
MKIRRQKRVPLGHARVAAAVALTLGALPGGRVLAQAADDGSTGLGELRQQVQRLQRQLQDVQARLDAAEQHPDTVPAKADAPVKAAADSPVIHAGPLSLTFGGFVEFAVIYRDHNEAADISSNFNTGIPYPSSAQYHLSEFRESARQSRLSLLTQGPQDGTAKAEAYLEMDFQSSAPTANSVESNGYNPRMRQYYAGYNRTDLGFSLLAGQAFSLVTLEKKGIIPRQEQIPVVIDGQYVPGFNWTRNPQLRLAKSFGDELAVAISFESPQAVVFNGPQNPLVTTVTAIPGGQALAPTVNYTVDVAPDVIVKVALDPGYGHYELYGLGRAFRDRAEQRNETIGGGGVGAGLILPLGRQVDFQASALVGRGIGRYGSAQLPDVTLRPDGELEAISAYQALVGLIYRPSSDWIFYGYSGIEKADSKHFSAVIDGTSVGYGYGSPLYDNSGCLIEGSTACAANTSRVEQFTAGAWWKYYEGVLGYMQVGLQGAYTRRTAFEGIGGDPSTGMAGGMVSFRYFPYQK